MKRANLIFLIGGILALLIGGLAGCKKPKIYVTDALYPISMAPSNADLRWISPVPFTINFVGQNPCGSLIADSSDGYTLTCTDTKEGNYIYNLRRLAKKPARLAEVVAPPPPEPIYQVKIDPCNNCKSAKNYSKHYLFTLPPQGTSYPPSGQRPIYLDSKDQTSFANLAVDYQTTGLPVEWVVLGSSKRQWSVTIKSNACSNGTQFGSKHSICLTATPGTYPYDITVDGVTTSGAGTLVVQRLAGTTATPQ